MPKRSRKSPQKPTPRKRRDANQAAFDSIQQIIAASEGTGKNPIAVAMGRLGGLKGGKARAAAMTSEERSLSAKKAAAARWKHLDE